MADLMTFPNTWEEYERFYGFTDTEEIYTNGARLIPSFRVKQWLEHIAHTAQPEATFSPIEKALHGLSPEEQAEFLINLMRGTLAYIDSRAALIKWLERGYWNGKTG